jgi:hypothetical protein
VRVFQRLKGLHLLKDERWAPLKALDFDGRAVISTAQLPDNRWEYFRKA